MTEAPYVSVSGTKIPYLNDWLYRVAVDGVEKDAINSKVRWTAQELMDVQRYYTESLTGYILGGEYVEGLESPKNPTYRPPVFQKRRRSVRAVEE